jgi:hypothetical protein
MTVKGSIFSCRQGVKFHLPLTRYGHDVGTWV